MWDGQLVLLALIIQKHFLSCPTYKSATACPLRFFDLGEQFGACDDILYTFIPFANWSRYKNRIYIYNVASITGPIYFH